MNAAQVKAAAASFGRTLVTVAAGIYLANPVHDLSQWHGGDYRTFGWAVLSAAVLLVFNSLRPGETRFGVGADTVPPGSDKPLRGDTPPDGGTSITQVLVIVALLLSIGALIVWLASHT